MHNQQHPSTPYVRKTVTKISLCHAYGLTADGTLIILWISSIFPSLSLTDVTPSFVRTPNNHKLPRNTLVRTTIWINVVILCQHRVSASFLEMIFLFAYLMDKCALSGLHQSFSSVVQLVDLLTSAVSVQTLLNSTKYDAVQ